VGLKLDKIPLNAGWRRVGVFVVDYLTFQNGVLPICGVFLLKQLDMKLNIAKKLNELQEEILKIENENARHFEIKEVSEMVTAWYTGDVDRRRRLEEEKNFTKQTH
jgi:hypothetical protein